MGQNIFFWGVRFFCFPLTVFWGAGAPVVWEISAWGCQDAAVPLVRTRLALSHQAAAKCWGWSRKDKAEKPWLVAFSWLLACIETNKHKHLNFLYASVHFGWHISFGKKNAYWELAASADWASPGRGVRLEVVCMHQDCNWISCRSVSFVGVIQGLKRHRCNFSWFCSIPNRALSGVHSWLSTGCIVFLRGSNNFLPPF